MTTVKFLADKGLLVGFEISGHSSQNFEDLEGKLVCSAISSAAFLCANTISDVIKDKITAQVEDGYMSIRVATPTEASLQLLKGFRLHIKELKEQFSNRIKIITEV